MKLYYYILLATLIIGLNPNVSNSQTFYRTGAENSIDTDHISGVLLAGGATDNDDAMKWFLERADGGDIVVIRATGSDGYNDYLYSSLGVDVNSVTTIVISSTEEANSEEVESTLLDAEAVFIAGGNQWDYINYWKDTKVQDALDFLITEKAITIGGTSAGMAVLGEVVFTAENNTVYSSEALGEPYHFRIKLDNDFLNVPYMDNVVTDTHYNRPENDDMLRKGRHIVFMARMIEDWSMPAKGIAANEYTAIVVDENGLARVFGDPSFEDYGYFLQKYGGNPEIIESGSPLTWNQDGEAVLVYIIAGDEEGSNTFDLANWEDGNGGRWEFWYVEEGELFEDEATVGITDLVSDNEDAAIFPNPANSEIKISFPNENFENIQILNIDGRLIEEKLISSGNIISVELSIEHLLPGVYFIKLISPEYSITKKLIKY